MRGGCPCVCTCTYARGVRSRPLSGVLKTSLAVFLRPEATRLECTCAPGSAQCRATAHSTACVWACSIIHIYRRPCGISQHTVPEVVCGLTGPGPLLLLASDYRVLDRMAWAPSLHTYTGPPYSNLVAVGVALAFVRVIFCVCVRGRGSRGCWRDPLFLFYTRRMLRPTRVSVRPTVLFLA